VSEVERLTAADQEAFETACHLAFHEVAHPDVIAMDQRVTDPERTFAVRDGGEIVATGANLARELTVPGGVVRMAGVSAIGVVPGHTRRGYLTAMMRRLLEDGREAGEPVAGLWASEGAIYGRFGFGIATRALRYDLQLDRVGLRRDAPLPGPRVQTLEPAAALERMRALHDRARLARPGMLDRRGAWWDRRIFDPEHRRDGAGPLRAAIQPGDDGEPAGYALFSPKTTWDDRGPAGSVNVRELVAETPEARAGLWRFLLGLDLVRTLQWRLAPDHDPLTHVLTGNDAVDRRAGDGLFVRLLDVGAALSARSYATGADLVLEVEDPFCPWNSGRHRLRDGRCEPTDDPAGLALDAEALGSIYLGGVPVTALAAAGRVRELRDGALLEATTAFRGAVEPWCPEIF
jgi:predicted acetyltransferase